MAGAGAKKRAEENTRRLYTLRGIIVLSLVVHIGFRLVWWKASAHWFHWAALVLSLVIYGITFYSIRLVAKPVYDARTGELLDGGADLSKGGLQSYNHDVLYITAISQTLGAFNTWCWLLWLLVPGYALYTLTTQVVLPRVFARQQPEMEMDEATRKKLERSQGRAERRRVKRF